MPTEKDDIVTPKAGALFREWMTSAIDDIAIDTELNAEFRICAHQRRGSAPGDHCNQAVKARQGLACC